MTFIKGQPSANPGGRPKGLAKLVRDTVEAEGPGGQDGWRELVKAMYAIAVGKDDRAKAKDSVAAAVFLRDAGHGRPQQAVDVTSNGQTVSTTNVTIPLATDALSDEQLEALGRALDSAAEAARHPARGDDGGGDADADADG